MKVKRFVDEDMRRAMARVRAELGSDAMILSARRVNGKTEISATDEYDPVAAGSRGEAAKFAGGEENCAAPDRDAEFSDSGQTGPSLTDIQGELARLRKLFESELSQLAWREMSNRQPHQAALIARLEAVGIARDIAHKIVVKSLPCQDIEHGWRKVLTTLARAIRTSGRDLMETGGIVALVGPTGVGKTTTAAKLAAHFALRHGRNKVAFITTDNVRVGGQEQLLSFGGILGIPVQMATTPEEMSQRLACLQDRKLVLIDTAGMSQRDIGLAEQLRTLAVEGPDIRAYLVLSAIAQESVINETIKAFAPIEPAGAIVTKTDEAAGMGAVISALVRQGMPAVFVGNGQRVPEDLAGARAELFIKHILRQDAGAGDSDRARDSAGERKAVNG